MEIFSTREGVVCAQSLWASLEGISPRGRNLLFLWIPRKGQSVCPRKPLSTGGEQFRYAVRIGTGALQ